MVSKKNAFCFLDVFGFEEGLKDVSNSALYHLNVLEEERLRKLRNAEVP